MNFKKTSRFLSLLMAVFLVIIPFSVSLADAPVSSCKGYLLGDLSSGDILIANDPDARVYPASTTKIMTALLLIENKPDLSETVTVGAELGTISSDSSVMGISRGEILSLKDLLYGMMLVSGNDAAATIAVAVGGSLENFADMMNRKAAELGMTNSHFVNPHGLHSKEHYTTTRDMFILARAAMQNSTFAQVVGTKTYTVSGTNKRSSGYSLSNTNKLISPKESSAKYNYEYCVGIKTGYTDAAGGCLVSAAAKDGQTYICIMMGDTSSENGETRFKRWTDSIAFFEYGFTIERVDAYSILSKLPLSATLPGDKKPTELTAMFSATSIPLWMDKANAAALTASEAQIQTDYSFNDEESIKKSEPGQAIGTAVFSFQGTEIYRCSVTKKAGQKTGLFGSQTLTTAVLILVAILAAAAIIFVVIIVLRNNALRKRRRKLRRKRAGQSLKYKDSKHLRDPHDYYKD